MTRKVFHVLLGLSLLMCFGLSYAQSVTIDNTEYRQKVLKYLASDYFITEGVGLKKVYLGQSQAQLIKELGNPDQVKKNGILSKTRVYYYKLDNETYLQVGLKNKRVYAIAFAGSVSSQYTTMKGARFNMSTYEIANLYGTPEAKGNSLIYSERGIRFDFKDGRLAVIRIFPRSSK
jgi:hypothetical protein